MASICSLRPNVSRSEAVEQFSCGMLGFVRELTSGPLRSVADFYIPFLIFQVHIANRGERQQQIWGIDGVNGSLDPYHFEQMPGPDELIYVKTRNCPPVGLTLDRAKELMVTKVQRLLFTTGFFRIRNLAISVTPVPGEIYVPYWVGFRGHGPSARFAVVDAVRRQAEGSRVRHLLQDWLTAGAGPVSEAALPFTS
jgi:hypothetical protein